MSPAAPRHGRTSDSALARTETAAAATQLVGISPTRVLPGVLGDRSLRALTRLHVSAGWVYATTGLSVTHLWNRREAFFDVDIDRRVITVATEHEHVSLSARFFSRKQLRRLHSLL